jgi:hypothetical protein
MNELEFLLDIPMLNNNNNKDTIWNQLQGSITDDKLTEDQKNPKRVVVFKEAYGKHDNVINYYKDTIYQNSKNPYKNLLNNFESKGYEALRLEAADFAYLSDLGVYPLNRLWILRRYKEGVSVPDNLLDFDKSKEIPYPISTVVGWISPKEENFFGVDFNEHWTTISDRVDEVLIKLIEKETGQKISKATPLVSSWGQGLLIGFLNEMGMTNFTYDEIPFGNPNVLQEAATRVSDPSQTEGGFMSNLTVSLKTSYEQKFIGDVDPGSAMLDIIRNLTRMGTSDIIFFADKNADIFKKIRNANKQGTNANAWWGIITELVDKFMTAVSKLFKKLGNTFTSNDDSSNGDSSNDGSNANKKSTNVIDNITNGINKLVKSAGETYLASTIAKWRWPLVGGVGVMTGENTTPWHLTIGNPNSPFVSFGNIKVTKMNIDFKNELGFNDMPIKMDVTVQVDFGRQIGAQEIFALFNNGYSRVYDTIDKEYTTLAKFYKTQDGIKKNKKVSSVKDKNGVDQIK